MSTCLMVRARHGNLTGNSSPRGKVHSIDIWRTPSGLHMIPIGIDNSQTHCRREVGMRHMLAISRPHHRKRCGPCVCLQVADEEIAKVPGWLAAIHCSNLCLSCHFSGNSGYLMFSHGMEIPEALLQNIFADYKVWSQESGRLCMLRVHCVVDLQRPKAASMALLYVQILTARKVSSINVMPQINSTSVLEMLKRGS